jgi:hypothetical protein
VIEAGIGQVLATAFMTGTGHMLLACHVRDATKAKEENAMQRIAKGAFFFLASGAGEFLDCTWHVQGHGKKIHEFNMQAFLNLDLFTLTCAAGMCDIPDSIMLIVAALIM